MLLIEMYAENVSYNQLYGRVTVILKDTQVKHLFILLHAFPKEYITASQIVV